MPGTRDPLKPPKPSHYHDPILKVLGQHVGFKSGVFVSSNAILPDIIREAGYDPDNLEKEGDPALGWTMEGQSPAGFRRQVSIAHRRFYSTKGTVKLPKGQPALTLLSTPRGKMALTEEGVKKAKELCGIKEDSSSSGGNMTSKFLDKRLAETGGLDGTLYTLMRAAVSSKLPLSASIDRVDDHIQNCLLNLIRRDALRGRILKGVHITNSHLATYAVRTGFTDIRKDGTEPVCREMYGARTERERAKKIVLGPLDDDRLCWSVNEDGTHTVSDIAVDGDEAEAKMAFENIWAQIREVVKDKKPQKWERYVTILYRVSEGWSVKEIAAAEDVSRHRAASLVQEARRCVREGRAENLLASVL